MKLYLGDEENKTILTISGIIIFISLILAMILYVAYSIGVPKYNTTRYNEASILASSDDEVDLIRAYNLFCEIDGYKDSRQYIENLEIRLATGSHDWVQKDDIQWCKNCGAIMDSNGRITTPATIRKDG